MDMLVGGATNGAAQGVRERDRPVPTQIQNADTPLKSGTQSKTVLCSHFRL